MDTCSLDQNKMIFCNKTFEHPASNIAFEQILLESAEQTDPSTEFLRVWHPQSCMVVLGRGGKVDDDVHLDQCDADHIPVIRRISGGGTIITGPGCLMYTVVLSLAENPALRDITFCHQFVGNKIKQAYAQLNVDIQLQGHSDLCVGDKKFSGNAMRIGRTHLIYHGTLLIDFDLPLIPKYLKLPPRRPEYREARDHLDFVRNVQVDVDALSDSIQHVFESTDGTLKWEEERLDSLLKERFENPKWNLRF